MSASRARRRAAASGTGPTADAPAANPGATAWFALLGEVLLTGIGVTVASLPLVTLPAALAAGHRHLRRYVRAEGSSFGAAWRDFARALPGGILVGAGALALAAVLAVDIAFAGSGALPGGSAFVVAGWAVAVAAAGALLVAAGLWDPSSGWRGALRALPAAVTSDLAGAAYVALAGGLVLLATWMFAPLLVPALGCASLASVAAPARPRRR
ncbi:hypothetical protein [Microbacterium indicum]|uniref:hypothetical protein n=1 Tax=Microbacterium indicum TaxID=358100 RepID=UPI0004051485|nr:hypothetical protein [Microbacterium indicum]